MGTGKTTIGRKLAEILGYPFYDTDTEVEQRAGVDIAWIFEVEGEEGFREREHKIIKELTEQNNIILATGGGSVVRAENRHLLRSRGTVVYLKTTREQQLHRVTKDKRRPLLQVDDKATVLDTLMTQREPLYTSIAEITVETGTRSIQNIVNEIIRQIE
jgi:shikimate kinase